MEKSWNGKGVSIKYSDPKLPVPYKHTPCNMIGTRALNAGVGLQQINRFFYGLRENSWKNTAIQITSPDPPPQYYRLKKGNVTS